MFIPLKLANGSLIFATAIFAEGESNMRIDTQNSALSTIIYFSEKSVRDRVLHEIRVHCESGVTNTFTDGVNYMGSSTSYLCYNFYKIPDICG